METLKTIGGCLLWTVMVVVGAFATFFLIKWGVNAAAVVSPYISWLNIVVFLICILILLPMAFFKKSRGIAGVGIFISSYVFGLSLWISGFLITYAIWGIVGVIVGVFLAGIGVVATAIIALILNGAWAMVGIMILNVVLVIGTRMLGAYLAEKAENDKFEQLEENQTPVCPQCQKEVPISASYCKHCGTKLGEV